ncbi:MAG TPA: hypothetical protein ENI62_07260 [Gammaproteobacteria bacterium]|nr:hypothetical protein [Gammaproteobacteria bacterium]
MKRKRTTPAYWQEQFAAQAASGLSVTDYLRRQRIRSGQWYFWKKRLRETASLSLVPVEVATASALVHDCRVHLPNGIVLEFSGTFEPAQLTQKLLQLMP